MYKNWVFNVVCLDVNKCPPPRHMHLVHMVIHNPQVGKAAEATEGGGGGKKKGGEAVPP